MIYPLIKRYPLIRDPSTTATTTPPLSPSPSFSPLVLPASISQVQETALHLAAGSGHHESVDLLIKAGSDVTATDKVTL